MPRLLPVALVAALALLGAGCGSKSNSQPETTADWANSVCTSITTWKDSVTTAAKSVQGGDLSKDSLSSAVNDAKSATDTLKSDLKDLGKPPTDSGQQAKNIVDQLATDLNTDVDSIKQDVANASGAAGAITAATSAAAMFSTMQTQLSSTLSSLRALDTKGELQTAFQQSSSCKQLTGSA